MKIATKDLTGPALDWAVAKAEGALAPLGNLHQVGQQLFIGVGGDLGEPGDWVVYQPSIDWSQGGPIIEREGINLWSPNGFSGVKFFKADGTPLWYAVNGTTSLAKRASGMDASPLIAAMRCYVAIKLGDEVDIPEELL